MKTKESALRPGQVYWKVGTRMAENNYVTHDDDVAFLDYAACLRHIVNCKQPKNYLVPVSMMRPCPKPPSDLELEHCFDANLVQFNLLRSVEAENQSLRSELNAAKEKTTNEN